MWSANHRCTNAVNVNKVPNVSGHSNVLMVSVEASLLFVVYLHVHWMLEGIPFFKYLPSKSPFRLILNCCFPWSMVCFAGSISVACVFMDFGCPTNSPKEKSEILVLSETPNEPNVSISGGPWTPTSDSKRRPGRRKARKAKSRRMATCQVKSVGS